jgi:hypothetical protein
LTQPVDLLCDVGHVESHFGPFADSIIVDADRCTVYAKRTTSSEMILNALDGTTR